MRRLGTWGINTGYPKLRMQHLLTILRPVQPEMSSKSLYGVLLKPVVVKWMKHTPPTVPAPRPGAQMWNRCLCGQNLRHPPMWGRRRKSGALAGLAAMVTTLVADFLPWLSSRFYKPADSLLKRCIKSSSFCPDAYLISRPAFYSGDKAFLSLQHIQVKSFVLGVFVQRSWKTSCTRLLVHWLFCRTFANSHCRCVGGRESSRGPETLTKDPFIPVAPSVLPY